jgi:tetratricopeptide (TPR) repeat protein
MLAHAQKDSAKQEAQEHYKAGLRHYNIGSFDDAITEWKEAYRLHGSPLFLFNIAQAYRMKNDYDQAIFFFTAYLRERPNAPNAQEVIELREEMERLSKEAKAQKDAEPNKPIPPDDGQGTSSASGEGALTPATDSVVQQEGASTPPQALSQPAADAPPVSASPLKNYGLITGGVGVAFTLTGVLFASFASSAEQELETASARGDIWDRELMNQEKSAERNALIAKILVGVGSAAIVGGGVMYFLGRKESQASAVSLSPVFDPSKGSPTVGLSLSGAF